MKNVKFSSIIFVLCLYFIVSVQTVFSVDINGILSINKCIRIKDGIEQVVKLNIEEDGIYILKTTGENDAIFKVFDEKNDFIKPIYEERNNNHCGTYMLSKDRIYYVNVKAYNKLQNNNSRLWLFSLDKANSISNLNSRTSGKISVDGSEVHFKFIPQKTNIYSIKSYGDIDLKAQIYNKNGQKIDENIDIFGLNFVFIKNMIKNEIYYIRVYSDTEGDFEIEISDNDKVFNEEINEASKKEIVGYLKSENDVNDIKFVPQDDGEYRFMLISANCLELKILDSEEDDVGYDTENGKCYSTSRLYAQKGEEYKIRVTSKDDLGAYKLKVVTFEDEMNTVAELSKGANNVMLREKEEFFKYICSEDGIFSFKVKNSNDRDIEIYNKNGQFISEYQKCHYAKDPVISAPGQKDEVLYLKITNQDIFDKECKIYVSNFSEDIKDCKTIKEGITKGTIKDENEEKFYKFVPQNDGIYCIKSNNKMYIDCNLYDCMGNLLSENNSSSLKMNIKLFLEKGNTYYLKIKDLTQKGTGDFCIKIEMIDYKCQYISFSDNIRIEDEIEYMGDEKYYCFIATDSDVHSIQLDGDADFNIVIIENGKKVVLYGANGYDHLRLKEGAEYEIYVFGEDEFLDLGEYSLKIDNFTKKQKNGVNIELDEEIKGNLLVADTEDYYRFIAKTTNYYSIYTTGELYTTLEIYDMYGNLVKTVEKGFDNNFYTTVKLKKANLYLLKVNVKPDTSGGPYGINIKKVDISKHEDEEWIKFDKIKTSSIDMEGEVRCYKFMTSNEGKYLIELNADIDMDVNVYDSNRNLIDSHANNVSTNCKCYNLESNSLYYVEVLSVESEETDIYNILVENIEKGYKNAQLVPEDTLYYDYIKQGKNTKYYKLIPTDTQEYLLYKIQGDSIDINIFDEDGNIILSEIPDDTLQLFNLEAYKTYYIRVKNNELDYNDDYAFFIIKKIDLEKYVDKAANILL